MKIYANGTKIEILTGINENNADYISLTDIAKYKNPDFPADLIKNWLRSRSPIEYLGLWEQLNNPNFKLFCIITTKADKIYKCNWNHIKIWTLWWHICT